MPTEGAPTLLVVDDEPLVAGFLVRAALESGWVAEAACTMAKFESMLDSFRPEVIVLDLAMPDQDGIQLLRYLVSQTYSGQLLFVSACEHSVIEESAQLAKLYGLDVVGLAQKPVTVAQFNELLKRTRPGSLALAAAHRRPMPAMGRKRTL